MLTNNFFYSVLKYFHSKVIGEELNVGILFVFPNNNVVAFKYPHNLSRLKHTYPSIPLKFIKSYLHSFETQAHKLSKNIERFSFDYNELVTEQFLVEDGSSLKFTKLQEAVSVGEVDDVIAYYYDLYLNNYNIIHRDTKPDIYIYEQWRKKLLGKKPVLRHYLSTESQIITKDKVHFKPDTQWQNGSLNLVKGYSFDLLQEDSIVDKALFIQRKLQYIEPELKKKKAKVDLLVLEPSTSTFNDAYSFALKLLSNTEFLKVYTENNIDNYVDKIIKEVHTLSE